MSADWSTLTLWLEGCELVINGLSDLTVCTGAGQEPSVDVLNLSEIVKLCRTAGFAELIPGCVTIPKLRQ